ncbi:hypothetical protein [Streptomyces ziwulingensis]|uniref:DUF2637 domain-containing protein n=1 Tax=Streptomyces ziwulingensis TaxID=1045501 RepID=A0ABP9D2I7_9ACTN
MTATPIEKQVNGTPVASPDLGEGRPKPDQEQHTPDTPAASSRREEKRRDRSADRAEDREDRAREREEARRDAEHQRQIKEEAKRAQAERKQQRRAEKDKARARRRKDRRAAWHNTQVKLAHHMPLWGLPVVAVSLVMGWSGQAQAASYLGMGWAAPGVPVLTEGMTMTTAGLTGQAIEQGRPYKWLLRITWANALVAAAVNALGHLIEDSSAAGVYRASAYAVASLAGLVLFAVALRSRRAARSGKTAEEIARWKRLGRRHPLLMRRARRVADNTGKPLADAWATVWERANGARPGEPSIREIRASRRAAYRRRLAQSWDGRRGRRNRSERAAAVLPVVRADAPTGRVGETPGGPHTPVQVPFLPVVLLVPGGQGEWAEHRVPVLPMQSPKRFRTGRDRSATTRFPQGEDTNSRRVQKTVADDRLTAVRKLVTEAARKNQDLEKHPSNRAVARAVGCRPATARDLLRTVLAERGITRN